jgi:hypothetical protein
LQSVQCGLTAYTPSSTSNGGSDQRSTPDGCHAGCRQAAGRNTCDANNFHRCDQLRACADLRYNLRREFVNDRRALRPSCNSLHDQVAKMHRHSIDSKPLVQRGHIAVVVFAIIDLLQPTARIHTDDDASLRDGIRARRISPVNRVTPCKKIQIRRVRVT